MQEGRAGLDVRVEGFSQKLPQLTQYVIQQLATYQVRLPCLDRAACALYFAGEASARGSAVRGLGLHGGASM